MNKLNNPKLTHNSQMLRKRMTKEEKHLWYDFLKSFPFNFCRQKVICNYIVDFYCAAAKIVVELDGSQHFEVAHEQQDKIRDKFLNSLGLKVLRYTNYEINTNFSGVCTDIFNNVISSIYC